MLKQLSLLFFLTSAPSISAFAESLIVNTGVVNRPQVQRDNGNFYWLSSGRPIVAPGTPFAPDLQAWIRNENLYPDWLRVGTDIAGGTLPPLFKEAFSLTGAPTPEPSSLLLLGGGLLALGGLLRRIRS